MKPVKLVKYMKADRGVAGGQSPPAAPPHGPYERGRKKVTSPDLYRRLSFGRVCMGQRRPGIKIRGFIQPSILHGFMLIL